MNIQKEYDKLMNLKSFENKSNEDSLLIFGRLIDISYDLSKEEGLDRALDLAKELDKRALSSHLRSSYYYCVSNIWSYRRKLKYSKNIQVWEWEQEETVNSIFFLRSAINEKDFTTLHKDIQCSIFTNLANELDIIGRFPEAIEYWEKAITLNPSFGMSFCNLGSCLHAYALSLCDEGHKSLFIRFSYDSRKKAQAANNLTDEAKEANNNKIIQMEDQYGVEWLLKEKDLNKYSLGDSPNEQKYRKWCLKNKLFLNPLNDLGIYNIVSQDILSFPDMITDIDEGHPYIGCYNQIKQEYIAARYIYYEGINSEKPHFADRLTYLVNTLDYPAYSIHVEKIKMAYRMAYSLFEKVAFLMNFYFNLKIESKKLNQVNFRTIWFKNFNKKFGLRKELTANKNWPLKGLFWLSKDIFEEDINFKDILEPDAKELNDIRNHLEHRYLKLHDMWIASSKHDNREDIFFDKLAKSLSVRDFNKKVLKLLKLTRAAIIYLTLAIHREERLKRENNPKELIVPMPMSLYEDDWKRSF